MEVIFNNRKIFIEDPNICPHCHITMKPRQEWVKLTKDEDNTWAFISVWFCVNQKCEKLFVALHTLKDSTFIFNRFLNGLPKGPDWPNPIVELQDGKDPEGSKNPSKFIKTYLQSLEAENYGFDELAGMGYRKSIEYLIKDWAIQNKPEDKDKIAGLWLGNVITNYYKGDLKEILDRATWLGNDQAHYNKLFEEFDIKILKELIDLIMVELDRQYKTNLYIENIKHKK